MPGCEPIISSGSSATAGPSHGQRSVSNFSARSATPGTVELPQDELKVLLEVPNDPDLIHVKGDILKDVHIAYRRYAALLAANSVYYWKKGEAEFKLKLIGVKQEHIDNIFFGRSNAHNYKTIFFSFNALLIKDPNIARIKLWFLQDRDTFFDQEIWGTLYKTSSKVHSPKNFRKWLEDV